MTTPLFLYIIIIKCIDERNDDGLLWPGLRSINFSLSGQHDTTRFLNVDSCRNARVGQNNIHENRLPLDKRRITEYLFIRLIIVVDINNETMYSCYGGG